MAAANPLMAMLTSESNSTGSSGGRTRAPNPAHPHANPRRDGSQDCDYLRQEVRQAQGQEGRAQHPGHDREDALREVDDARHPVDDHEAGSHQGKGGAGGHSRGDDAQEETHGAVPPASPPPAVPGEVAGARTASPSPTAPPR